MKGFNCWLNGKLNNEFATSISLDTILDVFMAIDMKDNH